MKLSEESIGEIAKWISGESTGRSSLFMATVALLEAPASPVYWPHDPADFRRCYNFLALLKPTEVTFLFQNLAASAPEWDRLTRAWPELCTLYKEEMNQDRAPKLYEMMRKVIA